MIVATPPFGVPCAARGKRFMSIKEILDRLFAALHGAGDAAINYPIPWETLFDMAVMIGIVIVVLWVCITLCIFFVSELRKRWRESDNYLQFLARIAKENITIVCLIALLFVMWWFAYKWAGN
jgi:hypothetical protein